MGFYMSMHLVGPWLTTIGKKKGPKKYSSAKAKQSADRARELRKQMLRDYNIQDKKLKNNSATPYQFKERYTREDQTKNIPSFKTQWDVCAAPTARKYTGTLVKGIATMHKSNAVPVINEEEMVSISRMRRG
jgi:hypothetical protein